MATLTETDYTRISTEASEHYVEAFYTALNGARNQIKYFYVPTTALSPDRSHPHISFNGELLQDAATFQERFEKQMPWTHFEPQSVNVHVLNPALSPVDANTASRRELERNMSLTVQVSGYVRLAERKEGPMRGFCDSFVLVPNKEDAGVRGTGRQDLGKRFLIQSQNFRFVV